MEAKNILSAAVSITLVLVLNVSKAQTWNTTVGNNLTGSVYLGSDGSSTSPLQIKTIETGGSALPINFFTNNIQRATILANGNVGIGTTGPSELLQVVDGNIDVNTPTKAYMIAGQPVLWYNANKQLVLGNENTKEVEIPASTHINGTIAAKQVLIEDKNETKDLLALVTQLQNEVAELKQQVCVLAKN